jgi:hypothetical protein
MVAAPHTHTAMHAAAAASDSAVTAYPDVADTSDVTAAIESLYDDELRPYGRIIRKRFAELAARRGSWPVDVDTRCLLTACERCPWLTVQAEEGGDWSALLQYRATAFVDVYSPVDLYPARLWAAASDYFQSLDEANMVLPGGRYSCAQALQERCLPFLEGRSLGQICHIVQLGISQKKLLGYLNGAVVPYCRSQSMVKERCAERQRPCSSGGVRGGSSNLADWEAVRSCLQEILGSLSLSPASDSSIPLSNVKRLFRSRFHTELSETALGHAKLSELFQDPRLRDICDVRLKGHGYVLVPLRKAAVGMPISIAGNLGLCADQEADIDNALRRRAPWMNSFTLNTGDIFDSQLAPAQVHQVAATVLAQPVTDGFPCQPRLGTDSDSWTVLQQFAERTLRAPTPDSGQWSVGQRSRSLPREATAASSRSGAWETACLALGFLPDNLPAPPEGAQPANLSLLEARAEVSREVRQWPEVVAKQAETTSRQDALSDPVPQLVAATPTPTRTRRKGPPVEPFLTPNTLVSMGFQVRNTFIHAELPPSSPMAGSSSRACSCPRSMGSELGVL